MKNKENYEYLKELCGVKSFSSSNPQSNPLSPRVQYIMNILKEEDIKFFISDFGTKGDEYKAQDEKYVNIEVHYDGGFDEALIFIAHHDINNPDSENCQDNSASCANLLYLAKILKEEKLDKNIYIVFVDAEEIVSTKFSGAAHLARKINNGVFGDVRGVVNLELTANGTEHYISGKDSNLKSGILTLNSTYDVRTPFSDTYTMEAHAIPSVCIGTLSKEEIEEVINRGYCKTWGLCHSKEDTFERSANKKDMKKYVEDYLMKIVNL